jgi:hypothetical protein
MMQKDITQEEVAEVQLDQAIKLFLDEQDYFSSATLAGAAEEIFGCLLREKGKEPSLDNFVSVMRHMLSEEEIRAIEPCSKPSKTLDGILSTQLNQYRNWLKHYMKDKFTFFVNPKKASEELIDRACSNYWQLLTKETEQTIRFLKYQRGKKD